MKSSYNNPAARCPWARTQQMAEYHDKEWGVQVHDDRKIFEFLVLEGVQAGLSWEIVLRKRENYRRLFDNFDPKKVAKYDGNKIGRLLENPGIIRNRMKTEAIVNNAQRFLAVQKEFGSFDKYIWKFVGHRPIINRFKSLSELPSKTQESDNMSSDMKNRGFKFVGSTVCYAHMQATGMVNDHLTSCFRYKEVSK